MGMCVVIRLVAWGGDVLSEGGWDGTGDIRLPGGPGILMARHGTTWHDERSAIRPSPPRFRAAARLRTTSRAPGGVPMARAPGGSTICGDIMKVMMLCHQDDPSADQPDVFGGGC